MMIEAEMYGMMFRAKIVMRPSAPPENMSNMPRMPPALLEKISCARDLFEQGGRHSRHVRHVLGRRARAHDDLCPEHHAVHLGLDHHSAADGGVADPRGAEEGR